MDCYFSFMFRIKYSVRIRLKDNKKVASTIVTVVTCIALSCLVITGEFFQNWYKQLNSSNHLTLLSIWICVFVILGLTLYHLSNSYTENKDYIFLFILQFICFTVSTVSLFRYVHTLTAFAGSALALFFSVWLEILFIKNKQKKLAGIFAFYVFLLIVWMVLCTCLWLIIYSLEHGIWKD